MDTLNIREAQITQEKIDQLEVKIVTRPSYNEKDEKRLLDNLRMYLGEEMKIRFKIVDEIPRTAQGKFKFIISKIPIQFHESKSSDIE
jgi:phenylacetate-CoA ligase